MSIINLVAASKQFATVGGTVVALDAVSLAVEPGEFVVVLGPSGSGKTTLLNLIGALDVPTAGTVRVAGRDLTTASARDLFAFRRQTVSFIFQAFNLFPELTAAENIRFGAEVSGRERAPDLVDRLLAEVGLGSRGSHYPHELSGGEQQRVAIARALATENPVLLADEPTGELDFRTGVAILSLLRAQSRAGRTVLLVTHNREIARTADRVVELSNGRVVSVGAPVGAVPVEQLRW